MSDLFSVHIKTICGDEREVPRYYDMAYPNERHDETAEKIIAKFEPLRRK